MRTVLLLSSLFTLAYVMQTSTTVANEAVWWIGITMVILLVSFSIEQHLLLKRLSLPALLAEQINAGQVPVGILNQIKDDAGGSVVDVISQLHARLFDAQTRENLIADFGVDVLVCVDENLLIRAVNQSCWKFWKYRPQDLTDVSMRKLLDTESAQIFQGKLTECKDTGERAQPFVTRLTAGDQSSIYCEWQIEWTAKDQVFYCVSRDVTQRMLLELYKKEFVAMVSHDLRTPLGNVMMSLELLTTQHSSSFSEGANSLLKKIRRSVHRLLSLTDQLLDLEKSETGNLSVQQDIYSSKLMVGEAADAVSSLAASKDVNVLVPDNDVLVWADEPRICQVLINLLGNAIKFSPKKSTVRISVQKKGQLVEFEVTDEGPGIPLSEQSNLFKRFVPISTASASTDKSFGLGLVICKHIVEAHGQTIGVRSQVGQGSSFWFTLSSADE